MAVMQRAIHWKMRLKVERMEINPFLGALHTALVDCKGKPARDILRCSLVWAHERRPPLTPRFRSASERHAAFGSAPGARSQDPRMAA